MTTEKAKHRVLVVDDNKGIFDLFNYSLDKDKYEVLYCANGKDALEMLNSEKVDIIFLDMIMPKMYGIEFLNKLKASNITIPPVVIMTGFAADELIDEAITLGALFCLRKPFDVNDITKTISQVVH
ncbi:MAG: hypothetical protein A2252_12150 [Elusimicrobia bacterium RIFOXYA2_FULL_39_19]|nr:MAG: hypothetical protein A2252_12150 [Elusimicrobia bacterium RIFOXYA2_FULL_39_19]